MNTRNLAIEDALSPLIERAKIACGTYNQRIDPIMARVARHEPRCKNKTGHCRTCARLSQEYAAEQQGPPSREEIKTALRGLGRLTHDQVRSVIIRAFLRDTPEDRGPAEDLPPMQRLARTVAIWIMEVFDDACWPTEEEALDMLATFRPHTNAG